MAEFVALMGKVIYEDLKKRIDKNIVTPEDDGRYHIDDLFLTEYICNGR